jgi:hypothetical protein
MTVTFKVKNNRITPDLSKKIKATQAVPQQAFVFFRNTTPKRTGNARSHTDLTRSDVIVANYPYASKLDNGYSRQAPRGMSLPTKNYIKRLFNKIFRGT